MIAVAPHARIRHLGSLLDGESFSRPTQIGYFYLQSPSIQKCYEHSAGPVVHVSLKSISNRPAVESTL